MGPLGQLRHMGQATTIAEVPVVSEVTSLNILKFSRFIPYAEGLEIQRCIHAERVAGKIRDTLIVLEHTPVYTLGRSATPDHILWDEAKRSKEGIELIRTDRGGDVTYHGPGQLVIYPIIKLTEHGLSVHDYVTLLETIVIDTMDEFGIHAGRDARNRGVWVGNAKICAIGIRVSHQTTMHGIALNVNTNLQHFAGIVPCGLNDADVTSMAEELGNVQDIATVRSTLIAKLQKLN